jgi:hypothetical protein
LIFGFVLSPAVRWHLAGGGALIASLAFLALSKQPTDIPIMTLHPVTWLVAIGVIAGGIFLLVPGAIDRLGTSRRMLVSMVLIGLASRLVLFGSEPLLEIDYFRYIWDGGVLAAGENPYAWSPATVLAGHAPEAISRLAREAGGIVERINYPHLRTIYPPLAEAVFALANWLGPWDLMVWRFVLLAFDLTSLALLLALLRHLGRSQLWAAAYWWNPLIIQMFFNAAHMDAILLPFLLAAMLLALRLRPAAAAAMLAMAVAVKLWPVLLLPTLLSYKRRSWRKVVGATALFVCGGLVFLTPLFVTGLGEGSGLMAYATSWERNDALFRALVDVVETALSSLDVRNIDAARLNRAIVAFVLIGLSLSLNLRPTLRPEEVCRRMIMITAALFLLSPTAYPWYYGWLLPLLVLAPMPALFVWSATLPFYHLRFHPFFIETPTFFENGIVWLEHGPVLVFLGLQWLRNRVATRPDRTSANFVERNT